MNTRDYIVYKTSCGWSFGEREWGQTNGPYNHSFMDFKEKEDVIEHLRAQRPVRIEVREQVYP